MTIADRSGGSASLSPTTGGIRIPALDAVRAVGSILVLLTHVAFQTGASLHGAVGGLLARFDLGVALFFVLSGLLLVIPWAESGLEDRASPSWPTYLWHRFLRIMPAYWVVAVAAFTVLPANAEAPRSTIGATLTLTQIYRPGQLVVGLTQMWSLCTEVAFYLLLPIIGWAAVRLLRRHGVRSAMTLCALLTVSGLCWTWFVQTSTVLNRSVAVLWLPGYLPWFAPGLALGVLVVAARRDLVPRSAAVLGQAGSAPWSTWVVAFGLLLIASTPVAGPRGLAGFSSAAEALTKSVLYGLIAVLIVVPATFGAGSTAHRALASSPMRFLGRISYGLFLWHVLILDVVFRALDIQPFTGHFWPVLGMTLPTSLLVAWLSWVLVERPLQRFRSRGPGAQRKGEGDQAESLRPDQVPGVAVG